jgi:FKBP-type peptidyl-prolyl cis-trans isomerase 2
MQKGDFIRINYTGRLESGEIFDLTDESVAKSEGIYNEKIKYGPLPIIVGANFLISGLDKAVEEMQIGEKRKIEILPENGFGQRNPDLVRTVNKSVFREVKDLQPGMIIDFGNLRGRVQSISGGRVRVDFNNPLAGKKLLYDIEVVEKIEGNENKIKSILEFFGIQNADARLNGNEAEILAKIPEKMKETIADLLTKYVEGVEKIKFSDVFERKS